MNSEDVLSIYNKLKSSGVSIWIDGGWCVDALLGEQTREHPDLDIAVARKDADKLRELVLEWGYQPKPTNDMTDWNYTMKDTENHQVDVHVFEYENNGKNVYGIEYPFGSLTGQGIIAGQTVNCIAPDYMFKFKTAYEPKDKDRQDIKALAEKFGFEIPVSHG